ncbi:T9SS type A sorting domain-containing protein [bacterium]|nr:T9SS type A sorting domain-containing protein [bacterium]
MNKIIFTQVLLAFHITLCFGQTNLLIERKHAGRLLAKADPIEVHADSIKYEFKMNLNNDSNNDIIMGQSGSTSFHVISADDGTELGVYTLPEPFSSAEERLQFLGFYPITGSAGKEAVFGLREGRKIKGLCVSELSGETIVFDTNYRLQMIANLDGDSDFELVIGNISDSEVGIWGEGHTISKASAKPVSPSQPIKKNASGAFMEEWRSNWRRSFIPEVGDEVLIDRYDLNMDGTPDIPVRVEISDSINLVVYDGRTGELLWQINLSTLFPDGFETDDVALNGFYKFDGTHPWAVIENGQTVVIINPVNNAIGMNFEEIKYYILADFDNDAKVEFIYYNQNEKKIIALGWQESGGTSGQNPQALFCKNENATTEYSLKLIYESPPGFQLAFNRQSVRSGRRADFEGDGIPDVVLLRRDENDDPVGLEVYDGQSRALKWDFEFPQIYIDDIIIGFHGFADVNGDNEPEAFFGNNIAVTLDGDVHFIGQEPADSSGNSLSYSQNASFKIITLMDINGDLKPELIGHSLTNNTVQIWGSETSTSIGEETFTPSGFELFQNYPNPFNPSTTIHYVLEQETGIELQILNTRGQSIKTIISGRQPTGRHTAIWHGDDDQALPVASGVYFYRLRNGTTSEVKKLILLR